MTTIAYDGRSIAADGRATWGYHKVTDVESKLHIRDVKGEAMIIGLSGVMAHGEPLIKWLCEGADPKTYPTPTDENGTTMIVVNMRTGEAHSYVRSPFPETVDVPYCLGSGQAYAYGALAAGKSPSEAVAIAAQFDLGTGGKIVTYAIGSAVDVLEAAE